MKVYEPRPGLLFRGEFHKHGGKLRSLKDLKVGTVVCLLRRRDEDLEQHSALEYVHRPLSDGKTVDVVSAWGSAVIAADRIRHGGRVLLHCIAGRNRSGLVAALTMVILDNVSGAEALKRVREARPSAVANPAFEEYLERLLLWPAEYLERL